MKHRNIIITLVVLMSLMGIQTSGHTLEAASQNTDVTDGLVAYYPFNGNANDESGNGNHGTPTQSVTLTTGIHGDANGAYQFGGYENPGCITVNNSESLMFDEGCTFSVYVKPATWSGMDGYSSRNAEGLHCMFAKSSDHSGVSFSYSGNTERFHIFSHSFAQKWAEVDTEDDVKGDYLNKWIHIAFVYSSTHAKVYVNGILICEKESTPDFSVMNQQNLNIGQYSSWYPMEGAMDELRIYNRALNAKEVKQLAKYADSNGTYPKTPRYLVVWDNNDAKTTYALKDKPQVTLVDDAFVVTKDGQETSFPMGSTKRFTYERIMPGDINGDAKVDIVDVAMTINYLLSVTRSDFPVEAADLNKNGGVDSDDVTAMIDLVVNGPEAVAPAPVQQSRGNALYNYRNDGDFNAWLNIDVDSITYSCFDLDSIEYDNVVTQDVWTSDSCYRIPIETIDSIGFRAPKPIMASNLFYIRDYHAPYTTSIEGLTIHFMNTIHKDSIPIVGQVVLSATEMSPYEDGFAGKVMDVQYGSEEVTIVCEEISVGDIYKRLVLVGKVTNDIESPPSQARGEKRAWSDPWVNIEDIGVSHVNLDPIEFPIGNLVKITSPTPKLTCNYTIYISELWYEVYIKLDLKHPDLTYNFTVTGEQLINFAEFGELFMETLDNPDALEEWIEEYMESQIDKYLKKEKKEEKELTKKWFNRTKLTIPIPIPTTGVLNMELEVSPILKAKGELSINSEFKTDAWQSMSMKWKGFTPSKIITSTFGVQDIPDVTLSAHQDPFKSAKLDINVKGTLTLGFKTLLDVNLIHKKVLYAGLACDFGLMEVGGSVNFTAIDTEQPEMNMYDRFKDTNIKISTYAKGYAEAGVTPFDFLQIKTDKMKLYTKEKVYNLFPHFTEPTLPKYNNGHWQGKSALTFFSYPSNDIFIPCMIGMRIEDEEGNSVKEYQDTYRYLDEMDWRFKSLDMDVSDLPTGSSYKCYPTISFFGWTPFNAGPHHNFSVPLPVVASPSELTLVVGSTAEVRFYGGWDTFAVVIEEGDDVASVVPNGEARLIRVMGKKAGTASLKIEDRRSGQVVHVPITVKNEEIPVTSITLSEMTLSLQKGDTQTLTATVLPEDADNKTVTWESSDEGVATVSADGLVTAIAAGSCTITCSATDGSGVKAEVQVTVTSGTIPDPGNHEWVDLGLPSGTLWATCNVGASSPEEYGLYFAWGETRGYTGDTSDGRSFDWASYKWMNAGQSSWKQINKYTFADGQTSGCWYSNGTFVGDGLTELLPEDDAATANWGSGWRMPTIEQYDELINSEYTTTEWTTQNGVNGRKITSKRNGNSIFLPAAGGRYDTSLNGAGSYGYYWSRSLSTDDSDYARGLYFYSGNIYTYDGSRLCGRSVRPVRAQN